MRLILAILISILCTVSAFAQPYIGWVQRFNGTGNSEDKPTAIAVDAQGNVYVTGSSYSGTTTITDYTTIKYDSVGNQLWLARYDGPANSTDIAATLAIDLNGNVYVTGTSAGSGTGFDFATIKYYPNGDTAWVRRYNGSGNIIDEANAIAVDGNGNVYVTGSADGTGHPLTDSPDYTTIKYDRDGNLLWVAAYNGPADGPDRARALALDYNANVYVTGLSFGVGTDVDYTTIKYDPVGNQLWVARYNGTGNFVDFASTLAVDGLGDVIVTGTSAQNSSGAINFDYATVKYDPQGNQLWVARYNGPLDKGDDASAVGVDSSGNIYVTGSSYGDGTSVDFATIKYYPTGDTGWVRRYNGPANGGDGASAAVVDSSGNIYVTGLTSDSNPQSPNYDFATIKYDSLGNELWVATYAGQGNISDKASAISVDGGGNVYVTGSSGQPGFFGTCDFVTIKYSPTRLLKGDLDQSGTLALNDIALLLNCIFFGTGDCSPAFADINCDGFQSPVDVVILLNIFYLSTAAPCANETGKAMRIFV